MPVIAPPKGTRDFYPEEMAIREHIFASWEKTCRRYGFEKFDAPAFEQLELYTQKSGEEIEKQLYSFADKGGRMMALRPELTPSLARMVATRGNSLKKPVRWFSIPRLFRYERMQRGRQREFFQLNMDILGIAESVADAELVAAVVATMTDLGFDASDFSVRISSRNLLEQLFLRAGVPQDRLAALYGALDKRHKMPAEAFMQTLANALGEQKLADSVLGLLEMQDFSDIMRTYGDLSAVRALDELFELLDLYGMTPFIEFDISIVRGLAYYTGTVFEVFDRKRSLRAIAGGGRYDRLVSLYGGPDTPAVGFAAGDVVLGELMKEKGILPGPQSRSAVFIVSIGSVKTAIETARILRDAGIGCEFSLKSTGVGKQLKQADAAGSRLVVFVGGEEEQRGEVKLKDMGTGNESTVASAELLEAVRSRLQ
jgi:histidyl-tRNA synthetase